MSWGITLAIMLALSVAVALYVAWPLLVGRPREEDKTGNDGAGSALDELLVEKDATYSALKELEFDHAMGNLSRQDYQELAGRYEDKAVALLKTIDEVSDSRPLLGSEAPAVAGIMVGPSRGSSAADPVEEQVAALRQTRGKGRRQGATTALAAEIETEVARLRAKGLSAGSAEGNLGEEIELQVASLRGAGPGRVASPTAAPRAPVPIGPPICPACGLAVRSASAAFCGRCGAALGTTCPICGMQAEAGDAFCSACGTSLSPRLAAGEGQTILGGANV